MDGGITPKGQPLDVLISKVLIEEWSLTCPVNEETGHPYAPPRQIFAT